MVSFAKKYNRKDVFNIDTKEYPFVKLSELYKKDGAEMVHPFNGCFIVSTKLGESAVAIDAIRKQLVNLPLHMVDIIREIINDTEAVDMIKSGGVGYQIREYESHGKKCYTIDFVDN